jgi:hypothetical protein
MEYISFNTIDWTDENKFSPEKWTWLELLIDFVIPIGDHWYNSNLDSDLELKKGEIFLQFHLVTNYEKENLILDHFIIYSNNLLPYKVASTFEEAKEKCQKDFEKSIIETFFDLKQI